MNRSKISLIVIIIIILIDISLGGSYFNIDVIIITIVSGVLVGVIVLLINEVFAKTDEKSKTTTKWYSYLGKSVFGGKIKGNKIIYDRKSDNITFTVMYKGRVKQGFVAAEIISPYQFSLPPPNYDSKRCSASVFCDETVKSIDKIQTVNNINKDIPKLHSNNIEIRGLEWTWNIPVFAPKGDYRVTIGIWSVSNKDKNKSILLQSSLNSFQVCDDDDSHYIQKIQY